MLHHDGDMSHDYCLPGPDSWCKYQVDLALGTNTQQPCQWSLWPAIVVAIMPIFWDLSDIGLLSFCSRAMTQNQNENLHHAIWSLVPKEQYNSTTEVELAINLAVLYFQHWTCRGKQGDLWSAWTASNFTCHGCVPVCGQGQSTPYPASENASL